MVGGTHVARRAHGLRSSPQPGATPRQTETFRFPRRTRGTSETGSRSHAKRALASFLTQCRAQLPSRQADPTHAVAHFEELRGKLHVERALHVDLLTESTRAAHRARAAYRVRRMSSHRVDARCMSTCTSSQRGARAHYVEARHMRSAPKRTSRRSAPHAQHTEAHITSKRATCAAHRSAHHVEATFARARRGPPNRRGP